MNKIKKIILWSSLLSIVIILSDLDNIFALSAVIPVTYGLTFYFIVPSSATIGSGFTMMSIVMFLRYIIYPMLLPYDNIQFSQMIYFIPALFISIIEILTIHISMFLYYRKKEKVEDDDLNLKKVNAFLPFSLMLFTLFIIILYPTAYSNRHFVLSPTSLKNEIVKIPGIISQLLSWGEIILIVYFFSIVYKRYKYSGSKLYYYISILILLFPAMFFTGTSRLSLLMPLTCSVFMLIKIFRDKSKSIIFFIGIYGFFAMVSLSLVKFYGVTSISSASSNFAMEELAEQINAYFGGLKNVMIGLQAYANEGSSIIVFINDIFRNAMGISDFFVNDLDNSVYIFNNQIYGSLASESQDQICPTIIEGLFAFGPILFIIPTVIMARVVSWLDYKWATTSSLEHSYLYAYIGVLIGWCVPGNLMHLSSSLFNIMVPMMILFAINRTLGK